MSTIPQLRRAMLTPEQVARANTAPARAATPAAVAATRSPTATSANRVGGYVALWDSLSGDL